MVGPVAPAELGRSGKGLGFTRSGQWESLGLGAGFLQVKVMMITVCEIYELEKKMMCRCSRKLHPELILKGKFCV